MTRTRKRGKIDWENSNVAPTALGKGIGGALAGLIFGPLEIVFGDDMRLGVLLLLFGLLMAVFSGLGLRRLKRHPLNYRRSYAVPIGTTKVPDRRGNSA